MVFGNEREKEREKEETFSSMPKNERAVRKHSCLLASRNANTRKEGRKKLPSSNAASDCDKHENLSVGCQVPSLLPHVGKFDQEADATISTFENGAMLRRLLADIVDSLSISNE